MKTKTHFKVDSEIESKEMIAQWNEEEKTNLLATNSSPNQDLILVGSWEEVFLWDLWL